MISTFRQRNFALLWTAGLISLIGDWALYTAMPIYVLDRTGSAFQSGLVWSVLVLPGIVIGPLAGVYVDRWDRRRIMLWGNVVQTLAAGCLLAIGDARGIRVAMAVLLAQATLYAIYSPAENALLPTVVAEEHLSTANALNSLNDNIARVIGPLIGGLLYAGFGIRGIALCNMLSFASAAGLVSLVAVATGARSAAATEAAGTASESFGSSLRTGATIVWRHRTLRALFLVIGMIGIADGPLTAMLAPFIRQTLDRSAEDFGTFLSVRGVAGILGGLVIARIARHVRDDRLIVACLVAIGIEVVAIAVLQSFVLTLVLMVLVGPALIGQNIAITTLLQRNSEDAFRGRISALVVSCWGVVTLISTVLGSAASSFVSPAGIVGGVGAAMLLMAPASRGGRVGAAASPEPEERAGGPG